MPDFIVAACTKSFPVFIVAVITLAQQCSLKRITEDFDPTHIKMNSEQVCVCGSKVTSSQRYTCWTTCQLFPVISCTRQDERGRKATSQLNWCRGLVVQMWEESAFSALYIVGAFLCLSEHVELRGHNAKDLLCLQGELTQERKYFPSKKYLNARHKC